MTNAGGRAIHLRNPARRRARPKTRRSSTSMSQSLARIGITPTVTVVDSAQYNERTDAFDFDMTYYRRGAVAVARQRTIRSTGAPKPPTRPAARNWMGVKSPAIDAMIERLLTSESQDDFVAAAKALDRLLTAGRYVIPIYQWNISRIAHAKELHYPDDLPIFGDWPGWQPDVWWYEE